jgi:hypothetical protein
LVTKQAEPKTTNLKIEKKQSSSLSPAKKMTRAERLEEEQKSQNPAYQKQQAKKIQQARSRRLQTPNDHKGEKFENTCDKSPDIDLPDFLDYQDHVSPVFRIDLYLPRDEGNEFSNPELQFSHTDEEILASFSTLVDNTVVTFNEFCRPEFCKVLEDSDNKAISKKLLLEDEGLLDEKTEQDRYSCAAQLNFEKLLFPGQDIGPDIYSRYMGKVQVQETDRTIKGYKKVYKENGDNQEPTYVERFLKVADPREPCYKRAKEDILAVVKEHLTESKCVLELYR